MKLFSTTVVATLTKDSYLEVLGGIIVYDYSWSLSCQGQSRVPTNPNILSVVYISPPLGRNHINLIIAFNLLDLRGMCPHSLN